MRSPLLILAALALTLASILPARGATRVLGWANAPKGGTFTIGFPSYPKALLFYLGFDELSAGINALILETLLDSDPETHEPVPLLATEWTISNDKRVFTFKIHPAARFSDGQPVTSEDVKFTWDTVMNPKHKTAPMQAYFSSFESCTAPDPSTVVFRAKTLHFQNLEKLGGLFILPKHFFSKGDFNKAFNTKLLGSGPYILDLAQTGERVVVKRHTGYWGKALLQNVGRYNFDKIVFKAVPDYNVQFEMFKKGDLDYFYFLVAKMWSTETDGPQFQKSYILKLKAENKLAYATQGIAWNLRRPLFKDVRVRMALSHLMNREKMISELFFNNYVATAGVVPLTSDYHSPRNTPVAYDPKRAKTLLEEAGWTKVGTDGVLIRDGVRFEYEHLTDNPSMHRWLTVYQEELKKMGIKMNLRTQDWATKIKLTDDWQFDATDIARGRDIEPSDFNVMWGSKEADIKGSANITGYKNPDIDALAQKIDETFDRAARIPLVRKLEEILSRDQPLSFAWEPRFIRLAHWNRYSFPGKGYFAFSTWSSAFHYWWYDAEKDKRLQEAMKSGASL